MRELSILVFVVLVVGRVEPLSNYCSAVNRTELVGKLETCYNLKSLDVTASTTTTTSTTSQPASTITRPPSTVASSSNTNQLSLDQVFQPFSSYIRIVFTCLGVFYFDCPLGKFERHLTFF